MDPAFPFPDASFDVVTCVVSVDYLIKPLDVFKEVRTDRSHARRLIIEEGHSQEPTD